MLVTKLQPHYMAQLQKSPAKYSPTMVASQHACYVYLNTNFPVTVATTTPLPPAPPIQHCFPHVLLNVKSVLVTNEKNT